MFKKKSCTRDSCHNPSCIRRKSFREFSQNEPDHDERRARRCVKNTSTADKCSGTSGLQDFISSIIDEENNIKSILKRNSTADKHTITIELVDKANAKDEEFSKSRRRDGKCSGSIDKLLQMKKETGSERGRKHGSDRTLIHTDFLAGSHKGPLRRSTKDLRKSKQFVHAQQQSSFSIFDNDEENEELLSIHIADYDDGSKQGFGFSSNCANILEAVHIRFEVDKERLFHCINRTCFRVFLGPSVDETAVLTMESANRFLEWCGLFNA